LSSTQSESSTRRLLCLAPAKINLGLRILERRSDGYHELESLFAPLDLGDEVEVAVEEAADLDVTIEIDGASEGVPADSTNLASRAASRFAETAGLRCRIRLRVVKRIPTGAGLGGGSSDAGTVLRALHELFPGSLDRSVLSEIALDLGADVPFFLDPRPAIVRGIGERIEPVKGAPALAVLLANPGIPLATADVYAAFDAIQPALTERAPERTIPPLSGAIGSGWGFVGAAGLNLENDLEPIAVRLCPPVARLRERVRALGARAAGMSGSGPTVFGLFDSTDAAVGALAEAGFKAPSWARVATTLDSR
jgi:4-diphosphocytidyl-2-C-methyl-D-erythritol kinase